MLKPKRALDERAINKLRKIIEEGWAEKSELLFSEAPTEGDLVVRMLNAKGYLEIYDDVMVLVMSYLEEEE